MYNSSAGNDWDTALQQNLCVDPSVTYRLTFKAKANATTTFIASVGQDHEPYYDYGLYKDVSVGTTWQTYQYTFRSAATSSDELAKIYFGFGAHVGTFYVDDVRLIPDDLSLARNPSFEAEDISEWEFWTNGALADYSVPCSGDATDGDCAVNVDVTSPSENWEVQLAHGGLDLTADTPYLLSFDA